MEDVSSLSGEHQLSRNIILHVPCIRSTNDFSTCYLPVICYSIFYFISETFMERAIVSGSVIWPGTLAC